MNIDEIEKRLNLYETNHERSLALLLNLMVENQALLKSLLELQTNIITSRLPVEKHEEFATQKNERLQQLLAEAQAEVSKHF